MAKLSEEAIQQGVAKGKGWSYEGGELRKKYTFKSFLPGISNTFCRCAPTVGLAQSRDRCAVCAGSRVREPRMAAGHGGQLQRAPLRIGRNLHFAERAGQGPDDF